MRKVKLTLHIFAHLSETVSKVSESYRKVTKLLMMFQIIVQSRQHTLAFTPSPGKMDSFGLGGNGQLGTRSTSNRKSPALVKGPWVASDTATDTGEANAIKAAASFTFQFLFFMQQMQKQNLYIQLRNFMNKIMLLEL